MSFTLYQTVSADVQTQCITNIKLYFLATQVVLVGVQIQDLYAVGYLTNTLKCRNIAIKIWVTSECLFQHAR